MWLSLDSENLTCLCLFAIGLRLPTQWRVSIFPIAYCPESPLFLVFFDFSPKVQRNMRVNTLEVVWHKKEAIHAFDTSKTEQRNTIRVASGGVDCAVRIWLIRKGVLCDFSIFIACKEVYLKISIDFMLIFLLDISIPSKNFVEI